MNNEVKKITKDNVLYVFTLWLCVWAISPPLSYGMVYRAISLGAFCLFFVMTYNLVLVKNKKILFLLFFYIIYTLVISYLFDGFDLAFSRNIQTILFLGFFYIFLYYKETGFNKLYSLAFIILILFGIWNCITIYTLDSYVGVARLLAQSSENAEQFTDEGVGGYGLVYSVMPLIAIVAFLIYKRLFTIEYMVFSLFFTISGIWLVFKAGYSISFILLIISFVLVFALRKKNLSNLVLFTVILSFLWFYWENNTESIFNFLEQLFKNNYYFETKIIDIHQSINLNNAIGSVEGRMERYTRSINLFIDNPLFGCFEFQKVGKHSMILDKFAQYGFFIGSLFLMLILYVPYKYCFFNNKHFGFSFGVFVTFGLFALLNNIPTSLGVSLFIIYPILYDFLINKKGTKYHS